MGTGRIGLGTRLARLRDTAEGASVEYELEEYEAVADEAAAIDLSRERDLASAARGLRELPFATALFAEASRRALGLEPFRSQLVAGIAMCGGKLAQLPTGEGKTLAAVLPAFVGALSGAGVHVMTANDYLAERDAAWMGPVYALLGLRADRVTGASSLPERQHAYAADVTYLTAKEAGFDYLRDQLRYDPSEIAQRGFGLAVVDEADSILIDEARSPLVIAARDEAEGPSPARADEIARELAEGRDYAVDRAAGRIALLPGGEARAAASLGVDGMHAEGATAAFARIHAALYARELLVKDVDYVVKGGRALLVDALTGRVAEGRRWPYGVQAAVEAAEGIELQPEGRIYGSIAVQKLLLLYPRMAAMTATALPSAAEFRSAYGLGVVVVPPNRPSRRVDAPDRVYRTRAGKLRAAADEALRESRAGRPVLVGTASIRESEELAAQIAERGGRCVVLNAKDDRREAALVAAAGVRGALTISTNMAGRGTDIRLGGAGAEEAERDRLAALGGLYVIGTNRHESRRIDDQLRGRAGRQGEPGLTRFFVSLEDPLFERYGARSFLPREYREAMDAAAAEALDGVGPIEDGRVEREIDRAQRVISGRHAAIRESLRRFGLPLEMERRAVRAFRDRALLEGGLPDPLEGRVAGRGAGERSCAALDYIARLDRFWAEQLFLADDMRQGIGLSRFAQRDPGIEYVRRLSAAFDAGLEAVEAAAAEGIAARSASAAPIAEPEPPTGTWTYLVEEELELPAFMAAGGSGFAALSGSMEAPLMLVESALKALGRLLGGKRPGKDRDACGREGRSSTL